MAEFCAQCAEEMGFKSDFIGLPNAKHGLYHTVLCEGCGPIQVNSKGECVSDDCMCTGHNVPLDTGVSYWTNAPNGFDFKNVKVREVEYGEWANTIRENHMSIKDIDDVPNTKGNKIYVCYDGTYTLYEIM